MSAIFLSDVHLQDATSVKTRLVIRFLQEVASRFKKIFILGDLFDVWPGTTPYLIERFKPVTDVLHGLVCQGHEVHYIEGNHDFKLGPYFSSGLGIQVHPNDFSLNLGDKKVYLAHGDLGNPSERGYRILRGLLRQDLLHLALKPVPPKWIFDFGVKTSSASRRYQETKENPNGATRIRQIYRATAEKIFYQGYDVVVMGHTHLPDDVTTLINGRKCR
ncbi:UDP-2,3-diacylglucosamine diphosphatase, partial [bacterium]|nr:UDP-2,3-diacylglucosamine diphosphatase [bacterium]